MSQNYRIYINENVLMIGKNTMSANEKVQQLDTENFDFTTFYENLKLSGKTRFLLKTNDSKAEFRKVKKACSLIKAAGGLVENADGRFLFIFRNKKWDLPKGKVEKGERMKEAAVREVEEECGVKIQKLEKKICKTYHIYALGNKIVLKKTNWYKMYVKGVPELQPQLEEGITSVVWADERGAKQKTKNTFPLIMEVLNEGGVL